MNKRSQSSRKRVEEFKKLKEEGSAKVLASSYNSPAENQQAFSVAAGGGAEEQEVVDDIREEEEEVAAESETYLDRHKPQKLLEHSDAVTRLRAPRRTNLLISASADGFVKIWGHENQSRATLDATDFTLPGFSCG